MIIIVYYTCTYDMYLYNMIVCPTVTYHVVVSHFVGTIVIAPKQMQPACMEEESVSRFSIVSIVACSVHGTLSQWRLHRI